MTDVISIRRAELADAEILVDYNIAMARETENKILSRQVTNEGVVNLLKSPQYGFYLVAEASREIAGSLLITFEWSDWRNGVFWWIQSVYIKPEYRRRGVFKALYAHVKKLALVQGGVCGLRLYVHHNNHLAQQTYKNSGMQKTAYILYETEF